MGMQTQKSNLHVVGPHLVIIPNTQEIIPYCVKWVTLVFWKEAVSTGFMNTTNLVDAHGSS